MATSSDLLHWDQSPGTVYSPREHRPPLQWNATREYTKYSLRDDRSHACLPAALNDRISRQTADKCLKCID